MNREIFELKSVDPETSSLPGVPAAISGVNFTPPNVQGTFCLPAGQSVFMGVGKQTVESVSRGDVFSTVSKHDPEGEKRGFKVVETCQNGLQNVVRLRFRIENGKEFDVRSSVGHRFYVRNLGFEHAERISIGSQFVNHHGQTVELLSRELEPEAVPVYNFEVEEAHTYFVGDDAECSVLSHNQNCAVTNVDLGRKPGESELTWVRRLINDQIDNSKELADFNKAIIKDAGTFAKLIPAFIRAAAAAKIAGASDELIIQGLKLNKNFGFVKWAINGAPSDMKGLLSKTINGIEPVDILKRANAGLERAAKEKLKTYPNYVFPKDSDPVPVYYDALKDIGGSIALRDLITNPKYASIIVFTGPPGKATAPVIPKPKTVRIK